MKAKKELSLKNAKRQLKDLKALIALDENVRTANLLEAVKVMKEEVGIQAMRRMYFEMSLKFVNEPSNGADDDDFTALMSLHEVLNVL